MTEGDRGVEGSEGRHWPEDGPYTVHDMHDGLPDLMFRLMVNRGMESTLGLRFLAIDLANLSVTGKGKYPNDLAPLDPSR